MFAMGLLTAFAMMQSWNLGNRRLLVSEFFLKSIKTESMLQSYLTTLLRNFAKNRVFSVINILGLAIGITCFTIILLFVEREFSYDKFHRDPENVYRVVKDFINKDGTEIPDARVPPALSTAIRRELPEVESVTRFMSNGGRRNLFEYGDKQFYELDLVRIDSSFFQVFDFRFVRGTRERPFNGIRSVILTETAARKYFGDENPVGKIIRTNINNQTDFEVTGVLEDLPENSHFTFDVLIPFESGRNPDTNWTQHFFYTYARLKPFSNAKAFESKVQEIVNRHVPDNLDRYHIQSLTDIHLTSRLKGELGQNGDIQYVRILLIIGIFVLVIAGINYVNLITAQSTKRAKEIGVRKVTGAFRRLLVGQFLFESVAMVLIAFLLAVIMTSLLLPFTKQIFGSDLTAFLSESKSIRTILPCSILAIGILSGIYPALYLSSFQPLKVLRGKFFSTAPGIHLRQGLVVFQFVMSSVLIIGFLVIHQQLEFIRNKNLGFDHQNVLTVANVIGIANPEAIADDFRKISSVERVARASGGILGLRNSMNGVADKNHENHISLNFIRTDYDYIPTLKIQLVDGRNFSPQFPSDSSAIIINEAAVIQLGLTQPVIGQTLKWDDESGVTRDVRVIGVVKDFHFTSFHEEIKPFGFILEVDNGSTFFLRINSANIRGTLAQVEHVWKKHSPDRPIDYSFQDEYMATLHVSEERFQKLFSSFTFLAIAISCLGLFGLVTALAESKTKEIGIRKVLGSTVPGIIRLLTREFVRLVLIALVIASPLALFVTDRWLQGFAYRVDVGWQVFVLAGSVTLSIAFVTVCFQSIKAALANPVNSLRSE
jgi:putative ABC transport system permease protein